MKYTSKSLKDSLFRQYREVAGRSHDAVSVGIVSGDLSPWTPDVAYLVNAIKKKGIISDGFVSTNMWKNDYVSVLISRRGY